MIINYITYDAIADSVVQKIYCNGLQRVSLDTVLCNIPIKIGAIISKDSISDCIKMLFFTGYFEEISISNDQGVIIITVKECPIINKIKIYKNKTVKSDVIQQILDKKNIKSGKPLNNCSIYEVQKELQNVCYNFGKFNSTIKIVTIPLDRNRSDLQIIFSEGNFTKVSHINIFGNRSFSQKQLIKHLTLYDKMTWKNIKFYKIYQQKKLFYDLEKLRDFYLNRGYAKFHIDDVQVKLQPNTNHIYIDIYINEGYQYVFQPLVVCGNILDRVPEIEKIFKIKSKESYNNKKINEIEYNIKHILGKFGYIQPNIFIECNLDDSNKTAKLYIYVDVGNRFYVREIRFEGNDLTKDTVIRREIQQIEQTPLNYFNVLKDQKQLRRCSYFKTINTRIAHISNLSNQIDLIYKVEERNAGNLNFSLGFGKESGLNIQASIHQENLLGTGNLMSITATKNRYQTYFDASILKKYVGIKKNNITSKLFYNNCIHNKIDLSNYNMKNYGVSINYSYPLTMYKSYDIGLNYISNNLSQIEPQVAIWRYLYSVGINPLTIANSNSLNSSINFSANDILLVTVWTFNSLNQMYFPEYGFYISVTNNVTLPGSNNNYYKIVIDSNHYTSLDNNSKWILMNSIYTGFSRGLYKQKESPFYDNFYVGGIETIRGFQLNSIGPKAAYYNCKGSDKNYSTCVIKNSSDAVGGNAIILVKNELIIPIFSYINKSEYFNTTRVSLFIDAGTVWDTHWKDTETTRAAGIMNYGVLNHIRISSGISFKWISPIGPIVFSYAKLIKQYSGDIQEPFQFSIGKSW